jgi:hypothetical protein
MNKIPYIKPTSISFEIDLNQTILSGSQNPEDISIGRGTTNTTDITPQAKSFNMEYWDEEEREEVY